MSATTGVGRLESLSSFSCGWIGRNNCGTDRLTTENLTLCVLAVLVVSTLHMSSILCSPLVVTWQLWLGAVGVGCFVRPSQDRQLWIGGTMVSVL